MKMFRGVSGPGVAGNGLSSENHHQKWGPDSKLCLGNRFRSHFPFSLNCICDVDGNLTSKIIRPGPCEPPCHRAAGHAFQQHVAGVLRQPQGDPHLPAHREIREHPVAPLHRLPEGQRKDIPAPRPRPNNPRRKANYRRRLDREVREAVRTGQTQTSRTTKLWKEGLEKEAQKQAGQGVFASSGQGVSEAASSRAGPGSHWWENHGWQNRADRDAWNWHR